jgi:hypothetical protein
MFGSRRVGHPARKRRDHVELTCIVDGQAHLVVIDVFASAATARHTAFSALCGHSVTVGSMSAPPGPPCTACRRRSGDGP